MNGPQQSGGVAPSAEDAANPDPRRAGLPADESNLLDDAIAATLEGPTAEERVLELVREFDQEIFRLLGMRESMMSSVRRTEGDRAYRYPRWFELAVKQTMPRRGAAHGQEVESGSAIADRKRPLGNVWSSGRTFVATVPGIIRDALEVNDGDKLEWRLLGASSARVRLIPGARGAPCSSERLAVRAAKSK